MTTFSRISVLVPTRQRIATLATMLDSFERTDDGCAELVFRADEDDVETINALAAYRTVVGSRYDGYRSMARFYNEMLPAASGDVLMCGNDDMVFRTPGWATVLLHEANKHADGLFDLGVSTHNESHYPFATVSRKAVDAMGYIWHPEAFWGDIFLRDVMAAFGRCEMVPQVQVEHRWEGHPYDVLHIDPKYWTETHPRIVAEAVEKLRSMS